jgi:hypothetical protein
VIVNAAAAVGDLFLCVRTIATPTATVAEDRRDGTGYIGGSRTCLEDFAGV